MSIRTDKVSSVIKRILAKPLSDIAHEYHAGLVTVTAVRLSKDLHIAKVYLSSYGGKISTASFISMLEPRTGELRSIVGSNTRLRYTPELRFYIDDTLDQIENIQKLLNSLNDEKH